MTHRSGRLLVAVLILTVSTAIPAFAANEKTTETTLPAQSQGAVSSDASGTEVAALSAVCTGCYAAWGLWENGNTIRAKRASYTGEHLTFIHVHWAFIWPDPDSCADFRDGDPISFGTKEDDFTSSDQIKDSNYSQGGQHHWTNAGAHQWKDEGATWNIGEDGSTDICKDFGF